jgi:hypothetical protein
VQAGDDFRMLMQGNGRREIIAMVNVTGIHGKAGFSLQPKKVGFFVPLPSLPKVIDSPSRSVIAFPLLRPSVLPFDCPLMGCFLWFEPRIVRWVHVIDPCGAYTMDLNFGLLVGPDEVIGLGLHDATQPGVNAVVFSVSSLSPVPMLRVPDITVTCSI